jgi:hypothetical protein
MANQNNPGPFMPDFSNGPFSGALTPPSPASQAQIPNPYGRVPRGAAAAAIIDKFLEGMQTGRVRAFENAERQRFNKLQTLNGYYASQQQRFARGDISKEAMDKVDSIYWKAVGNYGGVELSGGEDQGKKKAGQGQSKKKAGQDQSQEQALSPVHHVTNIARGIFTGLAGGKLSPSVDIGDAMLQMHDAVYDKSGAVLPQYDAPKLVADAQAGLEKAAGTLAGKTWQDAAPLLQPYFNKLDQLNPQVGARARSDYQARFQSAPPPGSADAVRQQVMAEWAAPTASSPLGTLNYTPVPRALFGPPLLDSPQLSRLQIGGFVRKEGNIEITGADGKKSQAEGMRVNIPNRGEFWYTRDQDGQPQPVNGAVREIGTASPSPAKTLEERAVGAFKEKHKIPADQDLSDTQYLAAIREQKEAVEPTDAKNLKELNELLLKERQLDLAAKRQQLAEGKAEIKDIAGGIESGIQPPDLSRLYGKTAQVRAQLAKDGYDLTSAMKDWQATTTWIRSMNSSQQLRLRQATEFADESLSLLSDLSGRLSKQIDRKQYPVYNKAAMTAALNGVMGPDAANAANNLNIQITDLQSELAVVYKGGGSPTDKGLKQAMDILSGDWDERRLNEAIELSRKNLNLRLNSIRSVEPMSGSGSLGEQHEQSQAAQRNAGAPNPFRQTGGGGEAPAPPGAAAGNPTVDQLVQKYGGGG